MSIWTVLFFIHAVTRSTACTNLMDLANGDINYDMETIDNKPVDTVATYTCSSGYTLNGGSTRTCGTGGWSGSTPACEGL